MALGADGLADVVPGFGGKANSLLGDGTLGRDKPQGTPDAFVYDPRYPVQTVGGNNCCSPDIVPWGPYDQRPVRCAAMYCVILVRP